METLLQNLRYAARQLARSPGFTFVAVVTLALGIGANTAIFSVVSSVLIRPLPYSDADRLMMIWHSGSVETGETTWLSAREVIGYRENLQTFESFGAYTDLSANLTGGQEPERVAAGALTASAFEVLGVEALVGRTFTAEEDTPGADGVVVLGHGLWQRRFGGDPDVIGTDIQVNGRPRTVLGVMPADFRLPLDYREEMATDLW
ncbi:MAG TPA: ABC transporter permease, partial [Longimicrobiaceae bacterium]|nr:ABC transporter permease [Longimicrobiaceae bacterium]